MKMQQDLDAENESRRAIWKAALIGLVVTAMEFALFALILKSNHKGWTVELFLLFAAPVAAVAGLIAFWRVPIATSPLLLLAIELTL
jgi:hypothetical protein